MEGFYGKEGGARKLLVKGQDCLRQGCFFFFFKLYLFILREREHEKGRGRERIPSRLHTVSRGAQCGARTHERRNHALSGNQESDVQLAEPPRHPKVTFPQGKEQGILSCRLPHLPLEVERAYATDSLALLGKFLTDPLRLHFGGRLKLQLDQVLSSRLGSWPTGHPFGHVVFFSSNIRIIPVNANFKQEVQCQSISNSLQQDI